MPNTPPSDTTAPPPEDLNARIDRYLAQLTPQQAYAPPAPVDRSTASLLGEALGGGTTGLAPADRESAGTRALLNFGLNMLSASGPSVMPRGFGQIFAQGAGGAQQSLGGSEAVGAARTAAQQAYEEKQQELQLNRIKEAIPLLKLQQGAAIPNTLISGVGAPAGPRTSIAAAGGADDFAQKFTPLAQTIAEQTGLPAEYVLAQAAHETGFGKSGAAANNNFFGITDPKTGKLASYATPQEGAAAYVQLMKTDRYANVPRTGTPAEIGDRMALAGYNPNVPAKDKTDSYGTRIGGVASMLAKPPSAIPPQAVGGAAPPAPYKVATTGATVPAPAPPAPAPGGKLTFEQFQALHPATVDPASYTVTPPNLDALLSARDQAKRQLDMANRGIAGDPDKALTAYTAAAKDVADAQAAATVKSAELRRQLEEDARTHQRALYTDEMKRQQEVEQADKLRAAELERVHATAEEQRKTAEAAQIGATNQKMLGDLNVEANSARGAISELDGLKALSDNVKTPSVWATIPLGNTTVGNRMAELGLLDKGELGATQMLQTGISGVIKTLRQGMAMGTLSDRDLNFIEGMGPNLYQDQNTRSAVIGYLRQAQQAKIRFNVEVNKEMTKPGTSMADAIDRAQQTMERKYPIVPQMPKDVWDHQNDPDPAWQAKKLEWAADNNVRVGTLWRTPGGGLKLVKPEGQK